MKREWAVLVAAMLFPSVLAAIYFVILGGRPITPDGNATVQLVYAVGKVFQFTAPLIYLASVDREYFRRLRVTQRGLFVGIVFGIAVGALIILSASWFADSILRDAPARVRAKIAEFGVASPLRYFGLACFLSIAHSFLEECFYRWFIFGRLRILLSFRPAAIISGLAFMGHHVFVLNEYLPGHFWAGVVPFSLAIAVGGVFWAWLYEKSGSLLGPWMSHLVVDTAIMYVGFRIAFPA